jgi:hypothetical protein
LTKSQLFNLFFIRFFREEVFMTVKRFSTLFCQLMGVAMFASLSIWSSSTFAACNNVVTSGLVGCYSFEGNSTDGSGNGNNGIPFTGVSYVSGKVGKAVKLNGTAAAYIRIPNPAQKFDREYTLSAWVSTAGRGQSIVSKYSWNQSAGTGFNAWTSKADGSDVIGLSGSTLFGLTYLNTANLVSFYPHYTLPVNQFKLVTIVYNIGKTKIYIDGQLVVEQTIPHTSSLDNPYDILVGNYFYNYGTALISAPYNRTFDGLIDELRIYNRAIPDAEITQLFNEGNAVCAPATYNGNTGGLQVPFIAVEGVSSAYRATMQQFASSFAFRVTQNSVATGNNTCPATYSNAGILHIPVVRTTTAMLPNQTQCYDVTMQAFSSRFQLDLGTLKVVKCP